MAERKSKPDELALKEREVVALERIAGALEAELGRRLVANALEHLAVALEGSRQATGAAK